MGLDIGCECDKISFRAGSYSGFSIFRKKLAEAVGINLNEMAGFAKDTEGKEWTEKEPFYELLNHSDCDGVLTPKQCGQLTKDFTQFKIQILTKWKCDVEFDYFTSKLNDWEKAVTHSEEECCTLEFG
jgi:hypothetical protein